MNEDNQYYANEFISLIDRGNSVIQQTNATKELFKKAFDSLNNIIKNASTKYQLSPILTINESCNELHFKKVNFNCSVNCLTISYGLITLSFFENTIGYNEENIFFHLTRYEATLPSQYTLVAQKPKAVFKETYAFEYHTDANKWVLCVSDNNGEGKFEKDFDEFGFLRILYNYFYSNMSTK